MSLKSLLTTKERDTLNGAVKHELYASNFYLYAASCMQKQGYFGFQAFFDKEANDEREHYRKLRDIMNDLGEEADMPMIEEVEFENETLDAILMDAHDMEVDLLEYYEEAYEACSVKVKEAMLGFVKTQRKAVGEYKDILARLELCGDDKAARLLLDAEMKG